MMEKKKIPKKRTRDQIHRLTEATADDRNVSRHIKKDARNTETAKTTITKKEAKKKDSKNEREDERLSKKERKLTTILHPEEEGENSIVNRQHELSQSLRGLKLEAKRIEDEPETLILKTELDEFYNMLKKDKKLKLNQIRKKFKIKPSTIEEWCRLFEEHGLATMNYPLIGRRFITYKEPEKETLLDKEEMDAGSIKGHKRLHEGKEDEGKHKFLKLAIFGFVLLSAIIGTFLFLRSRGIM